MLVSPLFPVATSAFAIDATFRYNVASVLLPSGVEAISPESQYDAPGALMRCPTAAGAAFMDGYAFLELARATLALAAKAHKIAREIGRSDLASGIRK